MHGIKTTTRRLVCALTLSATFCSAAPEYFPLQTGNSWAYRVTQGRLSRPATIEVGATQTIDGREYFSVRFFERNVLVRPGEDGSLVSYDPELKSESTWLPFGSSDKQPVQTSFDSCSKTAAIESRAAKVSTQLGSFDNALELRYQANCADAGITVQYFLPYVGLLLHETASIAGPVRHELIYSRTGLTNIDARINAFTLALDGPYKAGQTTEALARVTLRSSETQKLTFPSGQSSDLRITNANGDSVYFWSADKLFAAVIQEVTVGPGEKSWLMSFPVSQVPPGKYKAEGWLTTTPRLYSAQVSFDIIP